MEAACDRDLILRAWRAFVLFQFFAGLWTAAISDIFINYSH